MTDSELQTEFLVKTYKMAYQFGKLYSGLATLCELEMSEPTYTLAKNMRDELTTFIESELYGITCLKP